MKRDLCFIKNFRTKIGCEKKEIHDLLDDDLSDIPTESGVYIIASAGQKFVYPKFTSRIIYIGKTDNLQRRLKEHKCNLLRLKDDFENNMWCNDRYHYMDQYGVHIYIYKCRGKQDAKNLESKIMENFYERYLATPVGNSARSFCK